MGPSPNREQLVPLLIRAMELAYGQPVVAEQLRGRVRTKFDKIV